MSKQSDGNRDEQRRELGPGKSLEEIFAFKSTAVFSRRRSSHRGGWSLQSDAISGKREVSPPSAEHHLVPTIMQPHAVLMKATGMAPPQ
jgi:hypothetical protein